MTRRSASMVLLALVLVGVAVWGLGQVPTAFLPDEDQGYLIVSAQLPDGASKERTDAVMQQISGIAKKVPGVGHVVTVSGASILDNMASLANAGVAFVVLDDWDVRLKQNGQDLRSITLNLNRSLHAITQAVAFALPPPPIQGIGNVGGFAMQVEIRNGDFDYALLQSLTDTVIRDGNAQSALQRLNTTFRAGAPQLRVIVDRIKAEQARHHGRQRLFPRLRPTSARTTRPNSTSSDMFSRSKCRRCPATGRARTISAISGSRQAMET